jgi:hypothetical protein
MEGPMDRTFGHSAFDLDRDGKISGAEWALINETLFEDHDEVSSDSIDDDDDIDELEDDADSDDFDDDF